MKKKIKEFNQKDTILVVSAYPPRSSQNKNHGIAWYTKKLLTAHAKNSGKRFVVLSERNGDNRPFMDSKEKILVLRVFNRKHKSLYPRILKWLKKFNNISEVHVHSEFATRGISHFVLLIPFLTLIRAMGKRITFFSHNVIDDIEVLAPNLGVSGEWKKNILNMSLKVYYFLLSRLVDKIVILDKMLTNKISGLVQEKKIEVLPLSVNKKKTVLVQRLKRKLGIEKGEKVLLYFGFLTHYKGVDWLIREFDALSKMGGVSGLKLVVAGGPSYSLSGKKPYDEYYNELSGIAKGNDQITIVGHVPEDEIGEYFSLANLVVYPYRGFMGASGSLNHALQYGKPFMISSPMRDVLKGMGGSVKREAIFGLRKSGFEKVMGTMNDRNKLAQLAVFSGKAAENLASEKLTDHEIEALYGDSESVRAHGQTNYAMR